jgi:NAD(P)-dependent dehydrogenase (short-subunit alcohol dehydrogenase family)
MDDELFSVKDQVVLISGGSRGIGRAIAEGFASRQAHVIITGRDAATLEETAQAISTPDRPVIPRVCDVSDFEAIPALVRDVISVFERIDTLINVAGVNRRMPVAELSEDDYDFIFDINLKGAFLLSQVVGRHMLERGGGSQINIASLATHRPLKRSAVYAMSKAGMGQMTRALALEWGPHGVRVNAIAPGFLITDLTETIWADPGMRAWGQANIPQQRLGQPEEMVGTAVFLASPASAYMTGQILYVDGGFSAGWAWPIRE